MNDSFAIKPSEGQLASAVKELQTCNEKTMGYGLYLSEGQIQSLVEGRFKALEDYGRIELGGGIIEKLITAFCDSPYITRQNYEESLQKLQELFYYFKNETNDSVTDDDLIDCMKRCFDGRAQGSLEFLSACPAGELCKKTEDGYEQVFRHPM